MRTREIVSLLKRKLRTTSPDGPGHALVVSFVAWLMQRPLNKLIDPDWVADHAIQALSGDGFEWLSERHGLPALRLERKRVDPLPETLAEHVPDPLVEEALARLGRPVGLPATFWSELIDPEMARELASDVLADALQGLFSSRAEGGGGAGGILGGLARGATRRLKDAPERFGLLGFLGGEVQRVARELAGQVVSRFKEVWRKRADTSEGSRAVRALRKRAIERVLALRLAELHAVLDDPGYETLFAWAGQVLRHNLAQDSVRQAVREQVRAALTRERGTKLGAVLDGLGIRADTEAEIVRVATAQLAAFAGTKAFQRWLEDTIQAEDEA